MTQGCIVVDDERTARNILKAYINDVPFLVFVNEFKNAIEALEFIQENDIDIIFLDIEMPKLSGLNFAKLIKNNTKIIFTTAHREFALEGFELNATDYLLKPFSFDRFLNAVKRTVSKNNISTKAAVNHMYIKVDKIMTRVDYADLLYIEGMSNYVKVNTVHETLITYNKLSDLDELLPEKFVRVHKSYIVNTSKIRNYTKEYVEINKKHIPIGLTYRAQLLTNLTSSFNN